MRSERLRQRFQDILDNIIRIESFAAGHDRASFAADEKPLSPCCMRC
jgi:uncharacterized protein with HEPN domain